MSYSHDDLEYSVFLTVSRSGKVAESNRTLQNLMHLLAVYQKASHGTYFSLLSSGNEVGHSQNVERNIPLGTVESASWSIIVVSSSSMIRMRFAESIWWNPPLAVINLLKPNKFDKEEGSGNNQYSLKSRFSPERLRVPGVVVRMSARYVFHSLCYLQSWL